MLYICSFCVWIILELWTTRVLTVPLVGEQSIVGNMSVSVCLSKSISPKLQSFTNFFLCVTYGCGSVLLWWLCDTLCTSIFMYNVMFAYSGQEWVMRYGCILKATWHVATHIFDMVVYNQTDPLEGSTCWRQSVVYDCLVMWLVMLHGPPVHGISSSYIIAVMMELACM